MTKDLLRLSIEELSLIADSLLTESIKKDKSKTAYSNDLRKISDLWVKIQLHKERMISDQDSEESEIYLLEESDNA